MYFNVGYAGPRKSQGERGGDKYLLAQLPASPFKELPLFGTASISSARFPGDPLSDLRIVSLMYRHETSLSLSRARARETAAYLVYRVYT